MTQETGQRPNGAAEAILEVPPPHIDARAHFHGVYMRRFCLRRNFVRQCSSVNVADSPLRTELPGVLKDLNFGAQAGRPVSIYIRQQVYSVLKGSVAHELRNRCILQTCTIVYGLHSGATGSVVP